MTTAGGIIIWILLLFVLVASQNADLKGGPGAVCNFNVTKTVTHLVWNCKECAKYWKPTWYWCGEEHCEAKNKKFTLLEEKQKCCDGYENKNLICKPQCSPDCGEGRYCAQPNKCECINLGWAGQNCTESLWCVVRVNSTTILSDPSVKVPYTDTSTESKRPECLPQCLDQASNLSVNVTKSTNMDIYEYFLPIESPCNIEVGWTSENLLEKYKYPLAGALGIILCAFVIFCVTCFLRRKRKSLCDAEDIPMKTRTTQDYMLENTVYS